MKFFTGLYGMSMPGGGTLEVSPSVAFLCLGVAVACLAAGLYWTNRRREWLQHSAVAQGTVVNVFKKHARDDQRGLNPFYFPKVMFNVNGKRFEKQAEAGTEQAFKVGEVVPVRYNPENPGEAVFGPESVPVQNPNVFFIASCLSLLLGAAILL